MFRKYNSVSPTQNCRMIEDKIWCPSCLNLLLDMQTTFRWSDGLNVIFKKPTVIIIIVIYSLYVPSTIAKILYVLTHLILPNYDLWQSYEVHILILHIWGNWKKEMLSNPVTELVSKGLVFEPNQSVSMCKCISKGKENTNT